jgi:uncharacterized protein (DUF3084 family)
MSRILSMNCGSVDSLKVSTRWGLSPNARQIRLIADWDMPSLRARLRVDQWVASVGVVSKVMTSTRSTCSSLIVRGAPGRGSSTSPSSRWATNRARHLITVDRATPSCRATWLLEVPSAQASTIRHRNANAWALLGRSAQRCSVACSWAASTSGASSGPRRRPALGVVTGSMAGTY